MGEHEIYGLLGDNLGYSYSPRTHAMLGGYDYQLMEMTREEAATFVRSGEWTGLNVSVPYQEAIMPLCDTVTDSVRKVGSVNALVKREDGSICGHNTDYFGFSYLLNANGIDVTGRKVVVLGKGGLAKAVHAVLRDRGAQEVVMVGEGGDVSLDGLSDHRDAEYVVNASAVGMYPDCPTSLIDLEPFSCTGELREGYRDGLFGFVDTVYNPLRSGMAIQAEKLGVPAATGLPMFVAQVKASVELFTGKSVSMSQMETALRRVAFDAANIVLIGMPSAGKSTIGGLVAKKLKREFVDIDDHIPLAVGKSIPEIFAEDGEEAFRDIETEVTGEVCKGSGQVVACGGGVVTQPRNYDLLHQNGVIVMLRRPLDQLISNGRPMSISKGIPRLARERAPRYISWADVVVDNTLTPERVADRLIDAVLTYFDMEAL